jgi:hypothetical protein
LNRAILRHQWEPGGKRYDTDHHRPCARSARGTGNDLPDHKIHLYLSKKPLPRDNRTDSSLLTAIARCSKGGNRP